MWTGTSGVRSAMAHPTRSGPGFSASSPAGAACKAGPAARSSPSMIAATPSVVKAVVNVRLLMVVLSKSNDASCVDVSMRGVRSMRCAGPRGVPTSYYEPACRIAWKATLAL